MLAGAAVTVERSSGGRFPGHGRRPASPDLSGREQVELPTVAPDAGAALGVAGSARRDSGSLGFPWGLPGSVFPSPLLRGPLAAHICMWPLSSSVSPGPMRRHLSLFPRGHRQAFPLDFSWPKNSLVRRPWTPGRYRHAGRVTPRGTQTRPHARGRPSRAGDRAELPGEPDPRGLPQRA